jgi:hypothetical protein
MKMVRLHELFSSESKEKRRQRRKASALLLRLGSEIETVSANAGREIREMGPEGMELLLAELQKMSRQQRIWPVTFAAYFALFAAVWWIILFVMYTLSPEKPDYHIVDGQIVWSTICAILGWRQQRNRAAQILAAFDDVRIVGPLAEALQYGGADTRDAARRTLLRLLPKMQSSDASRLSDRQRDCLYALLESSDTELVLAILKALEQIGDDRAVLYVEALTVSRDTAIREAAVACLPFLKARAEQQRLSQTLLRASRAADTTPELLLRPARGTGETDPQQLLRPGV